MPLVVACPAQAHQNFSLGALWLCQASCTSCRCTWAVVLCWCRWAAGPAQLGLWATGQVLKAASQVPHLQAVLNPFLHLIVTFIKQENVVGQLQDVGRGGDSHQGCGSQCSSWGTCAAPAGGPGGQQPPQWLFFFHCLKKSKAAKMKYMSLFSLPLQSV